MNPRVKAIMDQVQQLTDDERMELETEMLHSAPAEQEELDKAWADECARRLEDVRAGRAKTIPVEDAIAEVRARAAARARLHTEQ